MINLERGRGKEKEEILGKKRRRERKRENKVGNLSKVSGTPSFQKRFAY